MNHVLQALPPSSEYPLSSEQECIDQISAHAHHSPFAGSIQGLYRRDPSLGPSASGLIQLPASSSYLSRPTHDGQFQTGGSISDSGTGSFSTSPSSNASSLTYIPLSSRIYPHQQSSINVANPYPTASHVYASPLGYSSMLGLSNGRPSISSITDPSTGMLPPATRSPGIGNPVSPSGLGAVARDNYTTATPHLSRHTLSPRSHADSIPRSSYNGGPETSRTLLSSSAMSISPPSASHYGAQGYAGHHDPGQGTPPFALQETLCEISCDGQNVVPSVEAKIEKGFFYSSDRCWTCYRRNYFSVQCSFSLNPHIPNGRLFLKRSGETKPDQIKAMAMSLSAAVDGATGKAIELVQHTPKRDKGPQLQIKKEKVAPMPPGRGQGDAHSYGMSPFHHPTAAASPYLPLQGTDEDSSYGASGHSTTHQHQHTFERIQFKSATANNGKRRAQQQYFHLIIELWADVRLDGASKADWVKVAQRVSAAVVVRGRSPSHYQNEGPSHHASSSRGGSGGGSAGGHPGFGSVGGGGLSRGYGHLSVGSSSGSSGGAYKGTQYALDPGHPIHVGDTIGQGLSDGPSGPSSDDESKPGMENFEGYQYFPGPLYEAGLPPPGKVESLGYEDRRVKMEHSGFGPPLPTSSAEMYSGGCGSRFQGTQTSRGYYPDLTGY